MRAVAEKTVDVSGSLSDSGYCAGNVNANAKRILDIESESTSVEDVPLVGTGASEAFLDWEPEGRFCVAAFDLP